MGLFDIFKTKKAPDETARRTALLTRGRITEGTVIESENRDDGEIITYFYTIHGVDFESSEYVHADRLADPLKYAPGAKVNIRFDPKNHGNSILE